MQETTQTPSADNAGKQPGRGTLVLVLGILSLVICALLGPVAWIMGKGDLKKMDAGTMDDADRSTTKIGMICGIIGTILMVLVIVWVVVMGASFGALASSGS